MNRKGLFVFGFVALVARTGKCDAASGLEVPDLAAVSSRGDESLSRGKREPDPSSTRHRTSVHRDGRLSASTLQDPYARMDAEYGRITDELREVESAAHGAGQMEDHIGSLSDYLPLTANQTRPDFFGGGNVTSQYFSYLFDLINRERRKNSVRVIKSADATVNRNTVERIHNSHEARHPPPADLSIVTRTASAIRVRWRTPAKYPVQYYLSITRTGNDTETDNATRRRLQLTALRTEYEFTGLEDGTKYSIEIVALYADGVKSTPVNITSFTPLPPPTLLSIWKITEDSFKATWHPAAKSSGVTGIRLHIEEVGGSYVQNTVLRPKVGHAKFTKLKPGTRYRIELQSVKNGIMSAKVTSEVTTAVSAPTNNGATHAPPGLHGEGIGDEIKAVLGEIKEKPGGYIEKCQKTKMTDLVILIDGSWSVGPDNFNKMRKFLISLAEAFHIGFDGVLMGIAQYSDDPRTEFHLNEHVTSEDLMHAINRIEYKGGNTATGKALDYLRVQMFSPEHGSRQGSEVRKTAVVITDGESILDEVKEPARLLREHGVEVFSVGVGAALRSELEDIATDPDSDHLFSVRNFDDIQSIKNKLLTDVCKSIPVCTMPEPLDNGRVVCDEDQLVPGSRCRFSCDQPMYKLQVPFEALNGVAVRSCSENGTWGTPEPKCIPAICDDLVPPPSGRYECTNEYRIGSYCTLQCDDGYKPTGEVRSRCRKDTLWTSTDAQCVRITCPRLPVLDNGAVRCDDGAYYRSECSFTCDTGYEMSGSPQTRCTAGERWSAPPPVCTRIRCSRLSPLTNGAAVCSDGLNYASSCTFNCLEGYELTGSENAVCDDHGSWVFSARPKMPVCERVTCDFMTPGDNVIKRCTNSNDYGSTCAFECKKGYDLIGSTSATCGGTRSPGIWSAKAPECRMITCPELKTPANGRVLCSDERNYSSRCTLACDLGFELKSTGQVECGSDGQWTDSFTPCGRIGCGEIAPVAHGTVSCSDYDNYNSRCTYQCHVGYKITSGSSVRVCGLNKEYTGEPPKCTIKQCERSTAPSHGSIHCSHTNHYGSLCRYSCDLGYELISEASDNLDRVERLCQEDEQWSGAQPSCRMISCGVIVPPVNGGVTCTDRANFGSVCKFTCNLGYEMTGPGERMCLENKKWTGTDTTCGLVTCGPLTPPDNGRVSCTAEESLDGSDIQPLDGFGTACDFQCEDGYELIGSRRRTCGDDRLWSGVDSACIRIRCPALADPIHASMACSASNEFGSVCLVKCDVGYYLSKGSAKRTCHGNSKWDGIEPTCNVKTCDNIVAKPHTTITCTNGNRFGSICTVKPEVGYRLRGPNVIECTDTGAEEPPVADLITCPPIDIPTNGFMTCNKGSEYDSVCSFVCMEGYDLYGPTSRTCMLNGEWTEEPATCVSATCPELAHPANGRVACSKGTLYQSICSFTCDEGYQMVGPAARSCRANHAWTGSDVACVRIECEELDAPKNGAVRCNRGNDFSSTCQVSCNVGYELKGSVRRVCRGDRTWDGAKSSCSRITCTDIAAIRNGRMKCSDDNNYASECEFVCEVGYRFSGSRVRTCQGDHTWDGSDVACSIVTCGELPIPENGSKRCADADNYDSKCRFACDLGYDLIGSKGRTCEADGTWSGKPTSCLLVRCGALPPPRQGNVSCSMFDHYESVCKYACHEGYEVAGTTTRVCQADHSWTGVSPTCQVVTCGVLKAPKNGGVTCTNGDRFNSACSYNCGEGYQMAQGLSRVCTKDRIWTGAQPTCELITCPDFDVPEHATFKCTRGLYYNTECTFTPKPGYTLNGPETIRCDPSGDWSTGVADFISVMCDELRAPKNGSMLCTAENYFDSTCAYDCNLGYELKGPSTRRCEETGEWTGAEPLCDAIECPAIPRPLNGAVACSKGYRFASECLFSCDEGFESVGSGTGAATCKLSSTWSKEPPLCILITCGTVPVSPHVTYTCTNGDRYNSVCSFGCEEGYKRFGSPTRTCLESHTWSGVEPTCHLIRCGAHEAPLHGAVSCTSGDAFGSSCTFHCNLGYRLLGDEESTCGPAGIWIGASPVCELTRCEELFSPANGEVRCTSGNDYNSICRHFCASGYQLIGSRSRTCSSDGRFTGIPASCKLISCDDLEDLTYGSVLCNDENNFNSECSYLCDEGYHLVGTTTRKCLASGKWSDVKPYCERIKCRKLRTPFHSQLSCTKNNEAGSICTVTCDSCYNAIGSSTRVCRSDGSWSGEEAACTAAQCDPLRTPLNGVKNCGHLMDQCGNNCTFTCKKGFRLLGPETRTCQENGLWTGEPAECIRNECPALLNLDNEVVVKCTDGNKIGSNCSFTCVGNSTSLVGSTHRVCLKQGVWSNTNPVCRACKTAVSDIMFIVDGSWSVGNENFRKAKDFLKALVQPFQVGWDNSRFAVIQYSDDPRTEFLLTDHLTTEEVMSAIDAIPYKGGNTNTGRAIAFSLYKALSLANGARPFVSKTALVLTDGRSQDDVGNPAREMRNAGIRVVTVGVGDADIEELKLMASPPHSSTVYHVSDYDSIKQIQTLLAARLCESDTPRAGGMCDCPAGPPGPPGKPGLPGIPGVPGVAVKGAKGDPFSIVHVNYKDQTIQGRNGDGSIVDLRLPTDLKPLSLANADEAKVFFPIRGDPGPPGVPGVQGSQGNAGVPGSSGIPGSEGAHGPAGPKGEAGPIGPPGARGPKGDASSPLTLSTRDKDEILVRAKALAVQIAQEEIRKALSELDRERRVAVRDPSQTRYSRNIVGRPGPPGPPGPAGLNGYEGPPGLRGVPGEPGQKGSRGEKGDLGDIGPKGPLGVGVPGEPGPRGPRGPRGKMGKTGKGKPGRRGPRGPRGPPGKLTARKPPGTSSTGPPLTINRQA